MKIVLSPMGTTGDIRPLTALGIALRQKGHEVVMAVPENGVGLCLKYQLPYQSSGYDYRIAAEKNVNAKHSLKEVIAILREEIGAHFRILIETAKGADLIIGGSRNFATASVAESYRIPYYQAWFIPHIFNTKELPPWRVARQHNPGWLNAFFWRFSNFRDKRIGKIFIDPLRKEIGLGPVEDYAQLFQKRIIVTVDRDLAVVPPDVKEEYLQTGYWHLFEEDKLPSDIEAFIAAGAPPVYLGFGSMPDHTPERTGEMLRGIAGKLRVRFLWYAGKGTDFKDDERVKVIGATPHHQLFPRVAAVIHHGGSGTTHTAAWAGTPQIITPYVMDQFFWGERMRQLGLGPTPIRQKDLDAELLEKAIREVVSNQEMIITARKMGERLRERETMGDVVKKLGL